MKTEQVKSVYIEAARTSDYGDGPGFAKVLVEPALLGKLRRLSALCVEQNLSEVRVYDEPEAWGPGDIEDELNLTCGELVVSSGAFWFVDFPKHSDYPIETRAQDIEGFCRAVEAAEEGKPLLLGYDLVTLAESVDESGELT